MKGTKIYVDPMFRRKLKSMAANRDMSMYELTRQLAEEEEIEEKERQKKYRGIKLGF